MDGYTSDGDDAERRRRVSDAARKRGARRWLNLGSRPPRAFERRELDEYEQELAERRRRHSSGSSSAAGNSSAGASCSRLTPVKREPEELGPVEPPQRRGVVGPEDYLPPGQEEHLLHVIEERSAREEEEEEARRCAMLEIDKLLFEQGVVASQAQASKDAVLRIQKEEQAAIWIEIDSFDEE